MLSRLYLLYDERSMAPAQRRDFMTRMVLNAAKCSQISDPMDGATSRGDRCTEVICAMIDATYQISEQARNGAVPASLMQEFAQTFNQGREVGVPEDVTWIGNWIKEYSKGAVTLGHISVPSYQEIMGSVNRGHIAIGGFSDYVNLQLIDGTHPYTWNDPDGLSHIVLIVGYDDDMQAVIVHDPLRGVSGQPADYSWKSFQVAQFYVLSEVNGPSLLPSDSKDITTVPTGWSDDGHVLTAPNGVPVVGDFRDWVLTHSWESQNWPLIAVRQMNPIEWSYASSGLGARQDFRTSSLGQTSGKAVYQIWVGQDILALAQQLEDCQSESSRMKEELQEGMPLPLSGGQVLSAEAFPLSPARTPSPEPPQPPEIGLLPQSPSPQPSQPAAESLPASEVPQPSSGTTSVSQPPSVHKTLPPHQVAGHDSANAFNFLTLFQRAHAYLPLTPIERSFLKFIQGAICTAIVAAASIIYQGLHQNLDWNAILHTALAAGATALLFTLNKYLTAQVDPALGDLVSHLETSLPLPAGSEIPPVQGT